VDTRQRILDATHRLLVQRGLARLTSKAIALESGLAEGTIFKHFGTKDHLLLMVVREHLPAFTAVASADRAGSGTVYENLVQMGLASIAYAEALIPIAAGVLADADLLARQREVLPPGGPARNFKHVADYVAAEQRLGRLDPEADPLTVAQLLLGPCFQWAFHRQILGQAPLPFNDEQFVGRIVETLLRGAALSKAARDELGHTPGPGHTPGEE
jgi:AcrR family transcriptional regulator